MAIAIISLWLGDAKRDYSSGIVLYDQYGKSTILKTLFKSGDSSYHKDRLFSALEELNASLRESPMDKPVQLPTVEQMPVTRRHGVTDDQWEKLPADIRDLYVLNSKLHRHSQLLFDRLRVAGTDDQRKILAADIIRERSQLNTNWSTIKDFNEKGIVKEKIIEKAAPEINDLSVAVLTREINNLPTYLSKDRKKINTMPDGPKKNKVLHRIETNQSRFDLIKKRLEDMQ